MTIKYGFLPYNEAKKSKETELPKKLFEYNVENPESADARSLAPVLSEDVYENLAGKTKFRFYITDGNGSSLVYQVNFDKEPRDFFESEIEDDIRTLLGKTKY